MARNTLRRYYNLGEKRLIEWDIRSNDENDVFVINKDLEYTRYEIYKNGSEERIAKGELSIKDKRVSFIFNADEEGEFLIKIFVTVPPETVSTELIAQVK